MRRLILFLCIALVILFSSCNNSLPDEMPDIGIDVDEIEWNSYIRLSAPKECNTYQTGASICLEITNLSAEEWEFHIDNDILIFQFEDNHWKKISDKMINIGAKELLLGPEGSFPIDTDIVSVLPDLEDKKVASLRIFIIVREKTTNGDGRREGAYIDIYLRP